MLIPHYFSVKTRPKSKNCLWKSKKYSEFEFIEALIFISIIIWVFFWGALPSPQNSVGLALFYHLDKLSYWYRCSPFVYRCARPGKRDADTEYRPGDGKFDQQSWTHLKHKIIKEQYWTMILLDLDLGSKIRRGVILGKYLRGGGEIWEAKCHCGWDKTVKILKNAPKSIKIDLLSTLKWSVLWSTANARSPKWHPRPLENWKDKKMSKFFQLHKARNNEVEVFGWCRRFQLSGNTPIN